jgi:hypothetical protein
LTDRLFLQSAVGEEAAKLRDCSHIDEMLRLVSAESSPEFSGKEQTRVTSKALSFSQFIIPRFLPL